MKKILILSFLVPFLAWGQTPTQISENLANWLDVPFLVNGNTSQMGQRFKFDKKIKVDTQKDGKNGEMYIFLNTKNGNYAFMSSNKRGELGDGSFQYSDPGFMLNFFTQKGEMFQFFNEKVKGEIKHYFNTSGTIIDPLNIQFTQSTINRKSDSKPSVNGFTTRAYSDGDGYSAYLIGANNKDRLKINKYLGFAGIGYVKTDGGIYMVTDLTSRNAYMTAVSWEKVNVEFDAERFTESKEAEFYQNVEEKANQKLIDAENKDISGPCSSIKMDLQTLEKENANKSKNAMPQANSGNILDNKDARQGIYEIANLKGNIMEGRLRNDLKICQLDFQDNTSGKFEKKKECRQKLRTVYDQTLQEMDALKQSYPNDPDRVFNEQMKLSTFATKEAQKCDRL